MLLLPHPPHPPHTADGEDAVRAKLKELNQELTERFRALEEEFR
jgi:hypothetical protein